MGLRVIVVNDGNTGWNHIVLGLHIWLIVVFQRLKAMIVDVGKRCTLAYKPLLILNFI